MWRAQGQALSAAARERMVQFSTSTSSVDTSAAAGTAGDVQGCLRIAAWICLEANAGCQARQHAKCAWLSTEQAEFVAMGGFADGGRSMPATAAHILLQNADRAYDSWL